MNRFTLRSSSRPAVRATRGSDRDGIHLRTAALLCCMALLTSTLHSAPIDITKYIRKQMKQSPVGLQRYESPEPLRQLLGLSFDQIMLDHSVAVDGAKVVITYDKAINYDVTSKNFTSVEPKVVDTIMDTEASRDKIDKKSRKQRRITRIRLKEEQALAGFGAALNKKSIDGVLKSEFDDKIAELKTDETNRILGRREAEELRALQEKQTEEMSAIKEQRKEKKIKPAEAKKQFEVVRTKYAKLLQEAEAKTLTLTPEESKKLAEVTAKPLEKLNGEKEALKAGFSVGQRIADKPGPEQDTARTALRKPFQDKVKKIAAETIELKDKDKTPRDLPMAISLTGVLKLYSAVLTPDETKQAVEVPPIPSILFGE